MRYRSSDTCFEPLPMEHCFGACFMKISMWHKTSEAVVSWMNDLTGSRSNQLIDPFWRLLRRFEFGRQKVKSALKHGHFGYLLTQLLLLSLSLSLLLLLLLSLPLLLSLLLLFSCFCLFHSWSQQGREVVPACGNTLIWSLLIR